MNDKSNDATAGEATSEREAMAPQPASPARQRRGFAVMDVERVREIARAGGLAAHVAGTAHEFNAEEARAAGRKGGLAPHRPRNSAKVKDATARG